MAKRRKKENPLWVMFQAIAVFFWICVLMFGLMYGNTFKNSKEFLPATATYTKVEEHMTTDSDGRKKKEYYNYFQYDANGKIYDGEFSYSSSPAEVGNSFTIYYDPLDPSNYSSYQSYDEVMAPVKTLVLIAIIFQIIAIIALIKRIQKKKQIKQAEVVSNDGFRKEAEIFYEHFDSGVDEVALYNLLEPMRKEIDELQIKYDKPKVGVGLPGPLVIITLALVAIQEIQKEKLRNKLEEKKIAFYNEYRRNIVDILLRKSFPDFRYLPAQGITEQDIKDLHIFGVGFYDRMETEDYVEGSYNGVDYRQSDLVVKRRGSDHTITVFSGRVGIYDYKNVNLKGEVVIAAKNYRDIEIGELKKAEMENVEFNSRFDVYADTEHLAYYLLTPHFMEYIMKLNAAGDLYLRFVKGKVCIVRNHVAGMFEPDLTKPLDIQLEFGRSYHELNEIKRFVDALNLDVVAKNAD